MHCSSNRTDILISSFFRSAGDDFFFFALVMIFSSLRWQNFRNGI
jgi:hypothetical protein